MVQGTPLTQITFKSPLPAAPGALALAGAVPAPGGDARGAELASRARAAELAVLARLGARLAPAGGGVFGPRG